MYISSILLAEGANKVLKGTEKLNSTQITAMTLVGLLVVFSALLILVLFLTCSGSIFKKAGKNSKPAPKKAAPAKPASSPAKQASKPAAASKPKPKSAPAVPAAPAAGDDDEVIAVIMAAIAAMNAADGTNYQLRSVRQVTRGTGRSAWAQAGLIEATKPF